MKKQLFLDRFSFFQANLIMLGLDKRKFLLVTCLIFFLFQAENTYSINTEIVLQETVSGTVTDSNGMPLPGVSIIEKGTNNGVVTDFDGNFEIEVGQENTVLVFSFMGFQTSEVNVNGGESLSIQLEEDTASLDEIVIVGYGETRRRDLTGAISSMTTETIERANKVTAFEAIQGQVAGVNVQTAGNKPGEGFNVRIRGANTINSGETIGNAGYNAGQNPLFVVDGMFVNDINFLNPNDIKRMDVLKDASATAIYGSRGSNGVILIQTKDGVKGELKVTYDGYIGVKQRYNLPDIYTGEDFVQLQRDAVVGLNYASGNFDFTPDDVDLTNFMRPNELQNVADGNYTDWVELIRNDGFQTNHSVGLSGGSEKTVYGGGISYTEDEGTFEGEMFERVNARANLSSKLSDYVTLGINNYATYSKRDVGSLEGFRSAYRLRPTATPFDENGEPIFFPLEGETFITNPLFEPANMLREVRTLNYLGNFSLKISPFENLDFTTSFAPNIEFYRSGEYRGRYSKSTSGQIGNTRAEVINGNRISYTFDNVVNYSFELNEDHAFEAMGVYSRFLDRYENNLMQRRGFSTDEFLFYNIDAGPDVRNVEGDFSQQTLESFAGRLNYRFKDRYLFTITGRYDGASILSDENKWSFFPSAAFAWRAIEEDFMQEQDLFNDLKLRISYGETGNNGSGGGLVPLGSQSLIQTGFTNLGDITTETASVTNLPNPNLTWERTAEYNFGLDFGLLQGRINGSIDLYSRETTGIIFYRPLPLVSGYPGIFDNVGAATNKGIEVGLSSVNIESEDFNWTTSINFARNVNEVTELYGGLDEILFRARDANHIHRVGEPIGSVYTYVFDGIWQMDEAEEAQSYGQQPGQVRVRDLNGDGVIDAENDRTVVGANMPEWTAGVTNTFNYRNLDFSFFVYANQGATSPSYFHQQFGAPGGSGSFFNGLKTDYWTPNDPSNEVPQPGNAGPFAEVLNFQDVSFVRVGFATLGYTFSKSVVDALGIKENGLRIYATAQNPFVFTDYEGWDPENAARNSYGSAYLARTFLAGLNFNF
ncbi:TonB-dependent receptor [Salegentibacter sp. LM13S]|uniref:SusC/RagA family TonB-linked outer membrane protein n=1 Tax=Salegentibacter lacus TaxID=2873599 RepID=UPI001CCE3D6B|nr:TonB-dependent receptor [Salegentibacter lacus]MBZ9630956.1 TonB-dependent receptor [Salegentibacter lacus]